MSYTACLDIRLHAPMEPPPATTPCASHIPPSTSTSTRLETSTAGFQWRARRADVERITSASSHPPELPGHPPSRPHRDCQRRVRLVLLGTLLAARLATGSFLTIASAANITRPRGRRQLRLGGSWWSAGHESPVALLLCILLSRFLLVSLGLPRSLSVFLYLSLTFFSDTVIWSVFKMLSCL
jgi:hypothetical protein